jgi:hypothetical protein
MDPAGRPARGTFGFEAGLGPNAPFPGRLVFVNPAEKERLNGVVISYVPNPTNTRVMMGTGQVNQEQVEFVLIVSDNTSQGASDTFTVTYETSTGPRVASGPLGGGNITIHPMCA